MANDFISAGRCAQVPTYVPMQENLLEDLQSLPVYDTVLQCLSLPAIQ